MKLTTLHYCCNLVLCHYLSWEADVYSVLMVATLYLLYVAVVVYLVLPELKTADNNTRLYQTSIYNIHCVHRKSKVDKLK